MELDKSFIENVLTLYDELNENGIYIVYIGKFTQRITSMFATMLEEELDRNNVDKKVKRRVYHAMVETMQNIQRHADTYNDEIFTNGLFMIGRMKSIYYIITINKVNISKKQRIISAINIVNNASKDELNDMYKRQLRDGEIGEEGGAGLGLIDIARKTENKLEYLFIPINVNEEYFVLKAEVDPEKFYKNS